MLKHCLPRNESKRGEVWQRRVVYNMLSMGKLPSLAWLTLFAAYAYLHSLLIDAVSDLPDQSPGAEEISRWNLHIVPSMPG